MVLSTTKLDKLKQEFQHLQAAFEQYKAKGLKLDMTRGKPSPEQLNLSNEMLSLPGKDHYKDSNGTDCRNYGVLDGLTEAKDFFAEYMGVLPSEVIIGGNSSLALMHNTLVYAMLYGYVESEKPWAKQEKIKFLCPVPGYDRHFSVCEKLGIEMIPVAMNEEGPDMDQVKSLVAQDSTIKGMWCVPQYSNPTGVTYSDSVVETFASMQVAAPDFKIMWDNAYAVHHLNDEAIKVLNLLNTCKKVGNPHRVFMFGSTSKISIAGAGIAVVTASEQNIAWYKQNLSIQTIGHDKINQLRHLHFFKDLAGLKKHMHQHAAILKPKFDKVQSILSKKLNDLDIASWSKPKGGYFISLDVSEGCAKRVVELAAEAGVKMTSAGATFPYKNDPRDCNIRIAPSLPSLDEIEKAMEVLCVCIKLAAIEKYA